MNRVKIKFSLKDICLIFFIFFFYLYRAIMDSNFNTNLDFIWIFLSSLFGGLYLGLKNKVKTRTLMMMVPFGVLIVLIFVKFNFTDLRLIMLFLAGLIFADENETNIIKIMLVSKILLIVTIVMFLGGFGTRNGIGANIGTAFLLYMCLSKDKLQINNWFLIFAGLLFLWLINPENAGVIVILLIVLILQLLRKSGFGKRVLRSKITQFIFPLCLFFTWFFSESINANKMPLIGEFLPASFNSAYLKFVWSLNVVLGTRLSLAKTALDRIGVHFIGADYYFAGYEALLQDAANRNAYFLVDSGYILLLIKWGLIVTTIICILSVITMKYYISIRAYNYVIAGIALAAWAILEDHIFYSFIWMFWGKALIEMRNTKKRRNIING